MDTARRGQRRYERRLYGVKEIAESLGVDDSRLVATWRLRGSHGIPEPDAELASGSVWFAETIEPWLGEQMALRAAAVPPHDPGPLIDRLARRTFRLAAVAFEERIRGGPLYRRARDLVDLAPDVSAAAGRGGTQLRKPLSTIAADLEELSLLIEPIPPNVRESESQAPLPAEALEAADAIRRLLAERTLRSVADLLRVRRRETSP